MALKARVSRIVNCVLGVLVAKKAFESPPAGALVGIRILDHYIDSSTLALGDHAILWLSFAELIDKDGAIGEVASCVSFCGLQISEHVVHSFFAFQERVIAWQDYARSDVNPALETFRELHTFITVQDT
jgi:hypothetical protein